MSSHRPKLGPVVFASIAALLVGAAYASSAGEPAAPASVCRAAMPPALTAPAGNGLAFELLAEGVQIYSCAQSSNAAGPAWALQAPEAKLIDGRGQYAGTHRAGPTWEALDGSSVVGAKIEAAPSDSGAIPWLLLRAASHGGGPGRMADVTFVQRIQTSGGIAPSEGCSAATVGAVARVPYHAVYCFYRSDESRPEGKSATPARSDGSPRP